MLKIINTVRMHDISRNEETSRTVEACRLCLCHLQEVRPDLLGDSESGVSSALFHPEIVSESLIR